MVAAVLQLVAMGLAECSGLLLWSCNSVVACLNGDARVFGTVAMLLLECCCGVLGGCCCVALWLVAMVLQGCFGWLHLKSCNLILWCSRWLLCSCYIVVVAGYYGIASVLNGCCAVDNVLWLVTIVIVDCSVVL